MNAGEKRRKNFPLERLFTVCKISPAIPKPMSSKLYQLVGYAEAILIILIRSGNLAHLLSYSYPGINYPQNIINQLKI